MKNGSLEPQFNIPTDPQERHRQIYGDFIAVLGDANRSIDDILPYADRINRSITCLAYVGTVDPRDAWVGSVGFNRYLPKYYEQSDTSDGSVEFAIAALRSFL